MKNKLSIIFVLIISNLFIFNTESNSQISFDVTEIEILDGGNKIIGKNRGTITTNNGIIIKANEFEFDKIKNILEAQGNVIIEDKVNNHNFNAENILYNQSEDQIEIRGKAEALLDLFLILLK